MATVSSLPNGKGLVIADSANQNQWDFSIPAQSDHQEHSEQQANGISHNPVSSVKPDDVDTSPGNLAGSKASRGKGKADPNYLSPYKQGLKVDYNGSRSGSEPDSLLDLYKQRNSMREKSIDSPMPSPRNPHAANDLMDLPTENKDNDPEQSRWIHKDKLAEIERREMEAAGIVPPPTRSKSRSRRAQSPEKNAQSPTTEVEEAFPVKEKKRRKLQPPPEQEREPEPQPEFEPEGNFEPVRDESAELIQANDFDLRTPDEIAAEASYMDRTTSPVYRGQHGLRSSSSRIPLPRSSPLPLPQEHLERSTPLPRKRGQSGDWDGEDSIVYHRSRSRGNSFGSQVLLDDVDTPTHAPDGTRMSSNNSPSKSRNPSSGNKHARKPSASTPNSTQKPRSGSSTQNTPRSPSSGPSIRPKSRSGLEPRPPTAINRPEGDAPWLKDMYKPDPMLPPDQQLLPTHAKRLQEEARRKEQWEQAQRDSEARKKTRREDDSREGGDDAREFSPLAEYTSKGLQPTPSNENNKAAGRIVGEEDNNSEWPLPRGTQNIGGRPPFDQTSSGGGPGTGPDKIGNAGYSPMPRVRPGVNSDGPLLQPGDNYRATVMSPNSKGADTKDPFEKERIGRNDRQDDDERERRKKKDQSGGCCRCVVM